MTTDVVDFARADLDPERESPSRVLIVDDAASTRLFLRGVLECCPQFDVVGEADNGATAIEMADAIQPDVILLDLSMPLADGASALGMLLDVAPNSQVIVLSGMDPKTAEPLLAAGATAFVPKGLLPYELLDRFGGILGREITVRRATAAPTGPATTPRLAPARQPRAVICDDDVMSRRLIAQVLSNCDVPVLVETDAIPNLLSVIELSKPELVVLDLWLEGTTGTTAIPEIRKMSPRTLVVVYSAYEEWKDKALAAGASAFIAKPNFDALKAVIDQLTGAAGP